MNSTDVANSPADPSAEERGRRLASDYIAAVVVAIVLLVAYLWRLLPGIGFSGDTIKFQFVGPTAGTVHETGYPVYLMLTWLGSRIPLGEIAARVNAMSALFSVIACVLAYFIMRRLGVRLLISAVFAIGLGLIPVVFLFAVVAEVYTLHLALMLAMFLVLLEWQRHRADWQLYLLMGLVAISFGNHMTTALLIPGILLFLWKVDRERGFAPKMVLGAVVAVVFAASLYGYVIWRASDPSTFYVEIAPQSFGDLVAIWMGGRFRGKVFGLGIEEIVTERLPLIGTMIAVSFVALIPFVVIGYRALRGTAALRLLAWWFGMIFVFLVGYDITDPEPYLIPLLALLAVLSAVGAEYVGDRWITSRPIGVVGLFALLFAVSAPLQTVANTDWSDDAAYESDIEDWLTNLPSGSLLAARYAEAVAAWNSISIGGIESEVGVLLVEAPDLDGDHLGVLDDYMRGKPGSAPRVGTVVEPGRDVYAGPDVWMCRLVAGGFALAPVQPSLYRVTSVRDELPLADRWTPEMRAICVEVDPGYADLS